MAKPAQKTPQALDPKAIKPMQKMPKDTPVLPSLAKTMGVEFIVNDSGIGTLYHNKPLPEQYWWAEYDVDLAQLYFVTVEARIQGLGFKIFERQHEHLVNSDKIMTIFVESEKKAGMPYIVPLVVRKHTLSEVEYGG